MMSTAGMGVNGQKLALVYRMPLGRDQQLAVVKVANRHVVIGCTPTQLTFITELSMDESDEFFSDSGQEEGANVNFTDILSRLREKKEKGHEKGEESE